MIRQGKVHAIVSTGANLEEDVFNLVAHDHYRRVPNCRELYRRAGARRSLEQGLNRVTDTCIPEEEAMRRIERRMLALWRQAHEAGERYFPYEYFYQPSCERASWRRATRSTPRTPGCSAAAQRDLPIFVPGWEDSTLGNMFVAAAVRGEIDIDTRQVRPRATWAADRLVPGDDGGRAASASSRSAAASPATSRSASCR